MISSGKRRAEVVATAVKGREVEAKSVGVARNEKGGEAGAEREKAARIGNIVAAEARTEGG